MKRTRKTIVLIGLCILSLSIYKLNNDKKPSQTRAKRPQQASLSSTDIFQESMINEVYKTYVANSLRIKTESKTAPNEIVTTAKTTFTILEMNKVYGSYKYCNLAQPPMILDLCSYQNCMFSCDRSRIADADAIIVYFSPTANTTELRQFMRDGKSRNSSQTWIWWGDEARLGSDLGHALDKLKFNWTISFHTQSEASYCAYGCYARRPTVISELEFDKQVRAEFAKRDARAIWFVSNCKSHARMNYAIELSAKYDLKVYGECADELKKLASDRRGGTRMDLKKEQCGRGTACEAEAMHGSKFYLSFENSNCTDYITEKFWRSLSHGLIPVVLQPSRADYERVAPHGSFIHFEDFGFDIERLASHLATVAADLNFYKSYVEWSRTLRPVFKGHETEQRRMCELCSKLNRRGEDSVSVSRGTGSYFGISRLYDGQCST
jgi:hypothetical protein